ncbi:hypothetical protein DFQ27_005743 [Actinomortierella ambigua]|uniref:DNA 3'-5' helicase n=1 Tax=Actinomortierella ambigua TaxID=1343610 RepID=A0A9P6Q1B0_9FUNG|nr:hypothetical protein DFQ27_005743 [Actinomortierella ambigua]
MPDEGANEDDYESDDVGPQFFDRAGAIRLCDEVFQCTPKEAHLQVMACMVEKRDCVMIAPCGWGKTLSFFLPMVVFPKRIIAIISPMTALMNDQIAKLVKANIPHIVLSGETLGNINHNTITSIANGDYRAVFISPEVIFGSWKTSELVRELWYSDPWRKRLLAIVVDEVHCIEKWGDKFRSHYDCLGDLRTFSPNVPFVGLTATPTADALARTNEALFLTDAKEIHVMDIHENVRLEVHTQPATEPARQLGKLLGNEKTVVYFEKVSPLLSVHQSLLSMRPDLRDKIGVYYSALTPSIKDRTMSSFIKGEIQVLLATAAAGMDWDIPEIIQVIQYGFPRDMPSMVKRFGRAGRNRSLQGYGILFAPPVTFKHPMDRSVRQYMRAGARGTQQTCRWLLLDCLFGQSSNIRVNCCDVCYMVDRSNKQPVSPTTHRAFAEPCRPKWPRRSAKEKELALKTLFAWRKEMFNKWVAKRPMAGHEHSLLPDTVAVKIAQNFSRAGEFEEVKALAWSCEWTPRLKLGYNPFTEIARVLSTLNKDIDDITKRGVLMGAVSMPAPFEDELHSDLEESDDEDIMPLSA